jgi:GT2 family glycosyltransferase
MLLGGMKEELFTGEDVDFCIRLRKSKLLIAYDPNVCVFHKNRDIWNFILQRLTYGASVPEIIKLNNCYRQQSLQN